MPGALEAWRKWADTQADFCDNQMQLSSGLRLSVEPDDRAIIGGVKFATMQTGNRKHSHCSVVLMQR